MSSHHILKTGAEFIVHLRLDVVIMLLNFQKGQLKLSA